MMMDAKSIRIVPKTDDAHVTPGLLEHFSNLKGYKIDDPAPDIRGWEVDLPDRRKVGSVDDLIVDTKDLSVRYVETKARHEVLGTDDDEWVLVPVQRARIDDESKRVIIDRLPETGIGQVPRFARGVPTKAQEQQLREYFGVNVMGEIIRDDLPGSVDPNVI